MSANQRRLFNGGKTAIHIEYSRMNAQWFVWRDDSGHVSREMFKTFQNYGDAKAWFDDRC